ncbi:MAG: MBL fold metallo-hydrolase [Alphaproteobacteria bacterium]|nr:MBL fold metallo-hydrolase [Alphaproteobacteria bacterium]
MTARQTALFFTLSWTVACAPHASRSLQLPGGVALDPVAEDVWRHTVTTTDGAVVNGLVVLGRDGAVLVDAGATPAQAEALSTVLQVRLQTPIVALVLSDADPLRTGGLAGVPQAVTIYASDATIHALGSRLDGRRVFRLDDDKLRTVGGIRFEAVHLGAGSDDDDVAVWFPDHGVLFGGDTVLAADDTTPVGGARAATWRHALGLLDTMAGAASVVVPGEGAPGDAGLLGHTRDLLGTGGDATAPSVTMPSTSVH